MHVTFDRWAIGAELIRHRWAITADIRAEPLEPSHSSWAKASTLWVMSGRVNAKKARLGQLTYKQAFQETAINFWAIRCSRG